jgi:exodeoxyribonuclease VII large subunit
MLDSLSPLRSLQRGYAILTDANGSVVTDAGTVGQGDSVQAVLAKGRLHLRVDKVGD